MPCVWTTARPMIRDFIENTICLDAVADLQASELNDLYDILEWEPSSVSSEEEVRNKKSLLTWITRNMPVLKKDDRRVNVAALLKESMQLRGVDAVVATPATSEVSARDMRATPAVRDVLFRQHMQQQQQQQQQLLSASPSPAGASSAAMIKPFSPAPSRATRSSHGRRTTSSSEETHDEPPQPVHATPYVLPLPSIEVGGHGEDAMDHDHTATTAPTAASPPSTALPPLSLLPSLLPSSPSRPHPGRGFTHHISEGLQQVRDAGDENNHDAALSVLGEMMGHLFILKKLEGIRDGY